MRYITHDLLFLNIKDSCSEYLTNMNSQISNHVGHSIAGKKSQIHNHSTYPIKTMSWIGTELDLQ